MSEKDPLFTSPPLTPKDQFLAIELDQIDLDIIKGKRTFTISQFPLKELIKHIKHPTFFYFSPPDESYEILSIGIAERYTRDRALHFIKHSQQDYLYFIDTFESQHITDQATSFLGEWNFYRTKDQSSLRVHTKTNSTQLTPGHELFESNVWESFLSPWSEYEETPEHDEWEKMIAEAHRLFDKKTLNKIVLSRRKKFTYPEAIEQKTLFLELLDAHLETKSFKILNQMSNESAFISLTPERLFKLQGNELQTIALAGSTMRGESQSADQILADELNQSQKLIEEHQYVIDDIKNKLLPLAKSVEEGTISIMKLPYIQHRMCDLNVKLQDNINPYQLIKALHPTAAVGGLPSQEALKEILKIEKHKRDFYAAPIGILSYQFSEVAVGIRSALIENDCLTLFGGAGIVKGSTAEEEWQETGTKMKPFLKVINKSII
jgi:isochorismate synthase